MAKCKYCGQRISRLDKDICPFCGGKKPLDGTDATTQDITKVLGEVINPKNIKRCSRVVAAFLAFLFGFLGIHEIYLRKLKNALITFLISAFLIGGIGTILFFTALKGNVFSYIIPYCVIECLMIAVGVSYLVRKDVTDGNGEFLE